MTIENTASKLIRGDGRTHVVTHQANLPAMFRTDEAQAGMKTSFDKLNAYVKTLV